MRDTIIAILVPVGLYLALGVLNALIAKRSQIDAWAEANPRAAALLKMMRALGFDPWLAVQSLTLALKGRLPLALKSPPEVEPVTKDPPVPFPPPPPVGPAILLLLLVALSQQACSAARQQEACSEANMAALVAKCRFRVETECGDIPDEECPAIRECDAEVDRRCGGAP